MTIEKGKEWGTSCVVPADLIRANSDRHLAHMPQHTVCSLVAGDLWHALGQPEIKSPHETGTLVSIDAIGVRITSHSNTKNVRAASSVEIGKWWSIRQPQNRYVTITNSGYVRSQNLTPRAHPNDGLLDMMIADEHMTLMQRMMASRRARSGSHIPHPQIHVSRVTECSFTQQSNELLCIDGFAIRDWTEMSITILPDFWQIII